MSFVSVWRPRADEEVRTPASFGSSTDLAVQLRMTKIRDMGGCVRARGIEWEVRKLLKGSILTGLEEVAGGNDGDGGSILGQPGGEFV